MGFCRALLVAMAAASVVAVCCPTPAHAQALLRRLGPCAHAPALTCTLSPTSGSRVAGRVTLTPIPATGRWRCITRVDANVTGLAPRSIHGWHIHSWGDVGGSDGKATGGHFNPANISHALPPRGTAGGSVGGRWMRHAGDLGNLPPASTGGVAAVTGWVPAGLTTEAVVGRGLIIHAAPDDGGQPTGNAGSRLAQCVLGVAAPEAVPPEGAGGLVRRPSAVETFLNSLMGLLRG